MFRKVAWNLGEKDWLRGVDLNHRPLGYEPNELPGCSTPRPNDPFNLSVRPKSVKPLVVIGITFHTRNSDPGHRRLNLLSPSGVESIEGWRDGPGRGLAGE